MKMSQRRAILTLFLVLSAGFLGVFLNGCAAADTTASMIGMPRQAYGEARSLPSLNEPFSPPQHPQLQLTPTPGASIHSPAVWIDSPLDNTILVLNGKELRIVAHAAFLTGSAELKVYNGDYALIQEIDLGNPRYILRTVNQQLSRYEGSWLPVQQHDSLRSRDGSVIYYLTVTVDTVVSGPVKLTAYEPLPTPTLTASVTLTSTPTALANSAEPVMPTAIFTLSPSATPSFTPLPERSPTNSPTPTPSLTATPTIVAASVTPSPTPTDLPIIAFQPKEEKPCKVRANSEIETPARVGPGDQRSIFGFLDPRVLYMVTGQYVQGTETWWQIAYTPERFAWVYDAHIIKAGNCLEQGYVEPPPVVILPTDTATMTATASQVPPLPPSPTLTADPTKGTPVLSPTPTEDKYEGYFILQGRVETMSDTLIVVNGIPIALTGNFAFLAEEVRAGDLVYTEGYFNEAEILLPIFFSIDRMAQ